MVSEAVKQCERLGKQGSECTFSPDVSLTETKLLAVTQASLVLAHVLAPGSHRPGLQQRGRSQSRTRVAPRHLSLPCSGSGLSRNQLRPSEKQGSETGVRVHFLEAAPLPRIIRTPVAGRRRIQDAPDASRAKQRSAKQAQNTGNRGGNRGLETGVRVHFRRPPRYQ